MTYSQYFLQFTQAGIRDHISNAFAGGAIPRVVADRLDAIAENIDKKYPNTVIATQPRQLTTHDVAYCLIYELYRMDRQKCYLRPSTRNINLSNDRLLMGLLDIDSDNLPFDNARAQSYATVLVCASLLYCHIAGRHVSCKTLLELRADQDRSIAMSTASNAKDRLVDIRKFTRNKYDTVVYPFLNWPRDNTAKSRYAM